MSTASIRSSDRLRETTDGSQKLFSLLSGLALVARSDGAGHAMFDMVVEDLEGQTFERGRNRPYLGQDFDAVVVFFDHALDPAHLSFDSVQASDHRLLVLGVTR